MCIRDSYTGARERLLQNFYIRGIAALGSKTFGATGTNTVVMFLEKFTEPPKQIDLSADSVDAVFSGAEPVSYTHLLRPAARYRQRLVQRPPHEVVAGGLAVLFGKVDLSLIHILAFQTEYHNTKSGYQRRKARIFRRSRTVPARRRVVLLFFVARMLSLIHI